MKMLIGLTGKTGSGKSSAARIFENLGAFVADCDKIAHEIINTDAVRCELTREFSPIILNEKGNIDRKKLGAIVFSDESKLSLLNSIMHKAIVDRAIFLCESSGKDLCVIDGSELESSGAYKFCNYTIVITADESIRLSRIVNRDKISIEDAKKRIRAQKDCGIKAIFIENNGSHEQLKEKISSLFHKFSGEINAK